MCSKLSGGNLAPDDLVYSAGHGRDGDDDDDRSGMLASSLGAGAGGFRLLRPLLGDIMIAKEIMRIYLDLCGLCECEVPANYLPNYEPRNDIEV